MFRGTLMTTPTTPWRLSSFLLALAGLIVGGIGAFFLFLRPPLLPEDVRYMQLSATEFVAVGPRLEVWLTQVFRVLGGYALATGLLTVALPPRHFVRATPLPS